MQLSAFWSFPEVLLVVLDQALEVFDDLVLRDLLLHGARARIRINRLHGVLRYLRLLDGELGL